MDADSIRQFVDNKTPQLSWLRRARPGCRFISTRLCVVYPGSHQTLGNYNIDSVCPALPISRGTGNAGVWALSQPSWRLLSSGDEKHWKPKREDRKWSSLLATYFLMLLETHTASPVIALFSA